MNRFLEFLVYFIKGTVFLGLLAIVMNSGGCGTKYRYVTKLDFSPDGEWLAITMYNWRRANVRFKRYAADICRTVKVVSLEQEASFIVEQDLIRGNQGPFFGARKGSSVAFAPDGRSLYLLPWKGNDVRVFDVARRQFVAPPWTSRLATDPEAELRGIFLSPDGRMLATATWFDVAIWDPFTGKLLHDISEQAVGFQPSPSVAFSSDSKAFAVAAYDGVQLRDATDGRRLRTIGSNVLFDCLVTLAPAGRYLALASDQGVLLADLQTADEKTVPGIKGESSDLAFSPDGTTLAVASYSTVALIDVVEGRVTRRLGQGNTLAFSPAGTTLAVGDLEGRVVLWSTNTWKPVRTIQFRGKWRLAWPVPAMLLVVWIVVVFRQRQVQVRKTESANRGLV